MIYSLPSQDIIKSPLRYPGGKGSFFRYFSELMIKNELAGGKYYEPYAGGSGVALGLLSSNVISEVILNDIDYHIYCFWISILNSNEKFIEKIKDIGLNIKEWFNQKNIYEKPKSNSVFDIGFSTFYLNRCNRSGILMGAGPIGGYKQKGKWKIDARFNKDNLIERIHKIGKLKKQIKINNLDAIDFLNKYLGSKGRQKHSFTYLDPPYVSAGDRLYLNTYSIRNHIALSDYLHKQKELNWVVSYDDNKLIRSLYPSCQKLLFILGYSLQSKVKGRELLIAPMKIILPSKKKSISNKWDIIGNI